MIQFMAHSQLVLFSGNQGSRMQSWVYMTGHHRDVELMGTINGSLYTGEGTCFHHSFERHQASHVCACVSNYVHALYP